MNADAEHVQGGLRLARLIRRLKERVGPEDLGGESVEDLVRRWSRVRSPTLELKVQQYDPRWPERFEAEKLRLQAALLEEGEANLQHFGSTAIPGLPGKNIIDIAVGVRGAPGSARQTAALVALGYAHYGASPIDPDFVWFWRIQSGGEASFVVHVCAAQHPSFANLIKFRDFMRRFPEERERYGSLKRELVTVPDQTWIEYTVIKRVFIQRIIERANAWAAVQGPAGGATP